MCTPIITLLLVALASADYILNPDEGFKREFGGIGAISGGGATTKLLRNYPQAERDEILDYLFKPRYGASLQILKVEIGGDSQSTDGVESSHMHSCDEEDYTRGYEWWLMKQAKLRNPDIKIYALPWVFPGWLADNATCRQGTTSNRPLEHATRPTSPYVDRSRLVDYVTRWIVACHRVHKVTVNYIGIWNERHYDIKYIKMLRHKLDSLHYQHVQIVAPDSASWDILDDLKKDPDLASYIGVIGIHYPGATLNERALQYNIPRWASEDFSSVNDLAGAGCWARVINEGYVNGYFTGFIAWNMINSYYDGLPYTGCSLMTANQPWSGHYEVNSPVWITAHMTHFTDIGWKYLMHNHGSGLLAGNGTYVTLTNGSDYTIIIQTMDPTDCKCLYPMPMFRVAAEQNITLTLKADMANIKSFDVYYSRLNFEGQQSPIMQQKPAYYVINSTLTLINVKRNVIYTFTTIRRTWSTPIPHPPKSAPFKVPYSDNFDEYPLQAEPYNFAAQAGVFEIAEIGVMSQVLTRPPIDTCRPLAMPRPIALIGDNAWWNVIFSLRVRLPVSTPRGQGLFLAARIPSGGCDVMYARGVFCHLHQDRLIVTTDYAMKSVLFSGYMDFKLDRWTWVDFVLFDNNLIINIGNESISLTVEEQDLEPGFLAIGTSSFINADFDDFVIKVAMGFE